MQNKNLKLPHIFKKSNINIEKDFGETLSFFKMLKFSKNRISSNLIKNFNQTSHSTIVHIKYITNYVWYKPLKSNYT